MRLVYMLHARGYERLVGPTKKGSGYDSRLAALGHLLDALAELGEPASYV